MCVLFPARSKYNLIKQVLAAASFSTMGCQGTSSDRSCETNNLLKCLFRRAAIPHSRDLTLLCHAPKHFRFLRLNLTISMCCSQPRSQHLTERHDRARYRECRQTKRRNRFGRTSITSASQMQDSSSNAGTMLSRCSFPPSEHVSRCLMVNTV